jgi:hypothetical protein
MFEAKAQIILFSGCDGGTESEWEIVVLNAQAEKPS